MGDLPHGVDLSAAVHIFTVVTAAFKVLYVFVVIDHATRKILPGDVTEHGTADWTLQQLREAVPSDPTI